jgi:hypothetical protein
MSVHMMLLRLQRFSSYQNWAFKFSYYHGNHYLVKINDDILHPECVDILLTPTHELNKLKFTYLLIIISFS